MGATALAVSSDPLLVPEDRVLVMIERCSNDIFRATTIRDAKLAASLAEAIQAVTRKIEASQRIKRDADYLLLNAEVRLGELTAQIPLGRRGGAAIPGQATKHRTLEQHGIHRFRAQVAEKLAATPKPTLEKALSEAKRKTPAGVATVLGYRQAFPTKTAAEKLAEDAVQLLTACCKASRPPRRDEVNTLELRLAALRVTK